MDAPIGKSISAPLASIADVPDLLFGWDAIWAPVAPGDSIVSMVGVGADAIPITSGASSKSATLANINSFSFSFDGVDDRYNFSRAMAGNIDTRHRQFPMTIGFKCFPTKNAYFFRLYGEGVNLFLFGTNADTFRLTRRNAAGTYNTILSSTLSLSTTYTVFFTFDGAVIRLFVNGSEAATPISCTTINNQSLDVASLQLVGGASSGWFANNIYWLGFWGALLTAEQMSQLSAL